MLLQLSPEVSGGQTNFRVARRGFRRRLARLLRLRREFREDLNPMGVTMLEHSIRATYRDCVDFGGEEQAHRLALSHGFEF